MKIDHHIVNNVLVVDVQDGEGRLIDHEIDEYTGRILSLRGLDSGTIAFNLSMKSYLNSTGLSDLIKLKDSLSDRGVEMVLISPSSRVMSLLEMAGVDRFFNIIGGENKL